MRILKFGTIWYSGCLVIKPRLAEILKELPWLKTEYHDIVAGKENWNSYVNYRDNFDLKTRAVNVRLII